uniref:uncharacterized protein LOC122601281 n=1 Tax=Erigeron canadensis TaxID=72917 RepID=UPI001CB98799|nr:uncharacterized protein LOC122601281 [Erigeron canadensis]
MSHLYKQLLPEGKVRVDNQTGPGSNRELGTDDVIEKKSRSPVDATPEVPDDRILGIGDTQIGGIDEDVTHRIQAGWMKWRATTRVMCDKRISLKLKGKFYRVAIRPAMLYGSECWAMTKAQAIRVEVAEMRMLRWTCGKTLADRILTGVFRAELEVGAIINKLREERLKWFGHVRRRDETAPLRRAESIHVDDIRKRGRPNMRWEDRLAKDLIKLGLSEDMTSDKTTWRTRIRVEY